MDQNDVRESLFDSKPSKEYLDQWKTLLKKERIDTTGLKLTSMLIFRIYDEWLAIDTEWVKEIVEKKPIHSIPHKKGPILIGTVSIRGQLKLVIALHKILELEELTEVSTANDHQYERMIVLRQDAYQWVILAHEVLGIVSVNTEKMENVPVTVSKSKANYLKGLVRIKNRNVGVLEEELVFFSLRRSVS